DIEIAVIIEIADRHASPRKGLAEHGACCRANVLESLAGILEEKERLFVLDARGAHLYEVIGMTVDQQKVGIPVIIIVKEFQPPPREGLGGRVIFGVLVGELSAPCVWGRKKKFSFFLWKKMAPPPLPCKNRRPHPPPQTGFPLSR